MIRSEISRRQFLKSSFIAATLAATGRLPLLGAQQDSGSNIDASTGPYAVKPIRGYLSRSSLFAEPLHKHLQYSLKYDIVYWDAATIETAIPKNSVIGQVSINREPMKDSVLFKVAQQTRIGGVDNFIKADITTNKDNLNSLRHWILRSHYLGPDGVIEPVSQMTEKGKCENGRIRIDTDKYNYSYSGKRPVVSQWTILDLLLRNANPALNASFDLLQDLSLFKPNQLLVYDGEIRLNLKTRQNVTLQTYVQTGEGILPTHYMLDEQGRLQLVTSSILSWALTG